MGRGSSVSIATRYGLDGPGIESRWGRGFPHPSRPALRPTQPPIQWVPGLSREVKQPGRGVNHPPPSSAEVKERVEPCLYSLLWAFVACSRMNFNFYLLRSRNETSTVTVQPPGSHTFIIIIIISFVRLH